MTNYSGTDVIRLIGITHPDEITTDSDYEIGHITVKVGNKVRITWNRTNPTEYVFASQLAKLDKDTFWLKSDISDMLPKATNTVSQEPVEVENDSDIAQSSDTWDEAEKDLNQGMLALSRQLGTLLTTPDVSDKPVAKPRTRRTPTKSVKAE